MNDEVKTYQPFADGELEPDGWPREFVSATWALQILAERDALRKERNGAWLIEWPQDDSMPARWWHQKTGWMLDANKAVRFSRKEDADAYIYGQGFLGGVGICATQHVWIDAERRTP